MKELLIIAISSALVSNVVLSQFLGICSFVGVSKKKLKQQLVWVVRLSSLLPSHPSLQT